MLVSIIIPCFEQSEYLDATILSARSQTYGDLEIIVVDDCSRDGSLGVAFSHARDDDRVRVVHRRVNGGLGRARNTGVVSANGELLAFLDSDDCLYPNSVAERVASFPEAQRVLPNCVGVFGDWQHTTENIDLPVPRSPRPTVSDVTASNFSGENGFICSAPLVTAEAVRAVGGFPEGVPLFEDFAMWARILATGGAFRYVPVMASTYRQRSTSMLRRSDVIGADYASTIVAGLRDHGVRLAGTDMLLKAATDASPRTGQRLAWLRSTEFGDPSTPEFGSAASVLAATDANTAHLAERAGLSSPELLTRNPSSLDDALHDAREISVGTAIDGPIRLVLVPSSIEAALETAAVLDHAAPEVRAAAVIALAPGVSAVDIWPCLHADAPIVTVDEAAQRWPEARWIIFGDDEGARGELVDRLGRESCVVRTVGTSAVRPLEKGAARRFRKPSLVLTRSRLESAELGGDRPVQLLGSGARHGLRDVERGDTNGPSVVYLPSGVIDQAGSDGWLSIALGAADEVSGDTTLMAGGPPRRQVAGFKARPFNLSALLRARFVIVPVCDEATLFEAIDVRTIVFEPSPDPALSKTWLSHINPARNGDELRRRIAGVRRCERAPTDSFVSNMAAVGPFEGNVSSFVDAFLSMVAKVTP